MSTTALRIAFATSAVALASSIAACSGDTSSDDAFASAETSNLEVSPTAAPSCSPSGSGIVAQGMCAICCAGSGPAKPIFIKAARCLQSCGGGATSCQNRCWQQYDEDCSGSAHSACVKAEQCATDSCFNGVDPHPGGGGDDEDFGSGNRWNRR